MRSAVPDALKAPATEKRLGTVSSKSVPVCGGRPKTDNASQFEWALKA